MDTTEKNARLFFADAEERQKIYRRKQRHEPFPWTADSVMQRVYLCNVFREQDRTTTWFRENVRDKFSQDAAKSFASIVLFRWFNRIETGEFLFKRPVFSSWLDLLLRGESGRDAGEWLSDTIEENLYPPYFTGAYMIKADNDIKKHLSVSTAASNVVKGYFERARAEQNPVFFDTLEKWTDWLTGFHGLGGFMAYEIVTDLRWTIVAEGSKDIMTWANIGPGCARGLSRLYYDDHTHAHDFMSDKYRALDVMRWLLGLSKSEEYWPQDEVKWEMRDVEHWLCEFDKIQRCRKGEGRIKRWYRGPVKRQMDGETGNGTEGSGDRDPVLRDRGSDSVRPENPGRGI
jgi:hypothetical protein